MKFWITTALAALVYSTTADAQQRFATKSLQGWSRFNKPHPDSSIEFTLAVKQNNLDRISALLKERSDPDHQDYGKYFSFDQMGEMVKYPEATAKIVEFLRQNGADKVTTMAHGAYIKASMSIKNAEKLINSEFFYYTHPSHDQKLLRTESYTIPESMNEYLWKIPSITQFSAGYKSAGRPIVLNDYTAINGHVTPQLLFDYYGIDDRKVTTTSSQGIYEEGQSYSQSDLTAFFSKYSLPTTNVSQIIGNYDASKCVDFGSCGEANLDVQYMTAIAQNSRTNYYVTDGFVDYVTHLSNDPKAPLVHSMSYTVIEKYFDDIDVFETEVQKLSLRGLTFIASSGDNGVSSFLIKRGFGCAYQPEYPASSPYVTAVGATIGPESGNPEVVCTSKRAAITSGGGFSNHYSTPDFQSASVKSYFQSLGTQPASGFNAQGRGYPDVAVLGRYYEIIVHGAVGGADGTSASAPAFAGMITLVNDCRIKSGKGPLGYLNPALYKLDASVFNDITSGDNTCGSYNTTCCTQGFQAGKGWDPVSGRGSPKFKLFKAALCAL
jgi:tripeptidyl-peptidase-1